MIVEARAPDGKLLELTEVHLSKSNLLILITDTDGNQVLVSRYAWPGIVAAVQELFAQSEREAKAELAQKRKADPDY